MSHHIKNITLSTQRSDISGYDLVPIVKKYDGALIPAHVFTPFKSYYGNCTDRMEKVFKERFDFIKAVELGLSADTFIADEISELKSRRFLTNSDAHSLPKIAREYNKLSVEDISFDEVFKAIFKEGGRDILENYGMDPKLGKYNRTFCEDCEKSIELPPPVTKCNKCGGTNITMGVFDRIEIIKDQDSTSPKDRTFYHYQIPLQFIPKVGGKTIDKLLNAFGTEMNILNRVTVDDLESVVGKELADTIDKEKKKKMHIHSGGGGVYGKIENN